MKSLNLLLLMVLFSFSVSAQNNGKDAVVALPNLNVLYLGISNPVEIAVPGVVAENITATITNGSISRTANGWEIKPSNTSDPVILTVLVNNQKITEKAFRVKPIPAPVAVLAGKNVGTLSKKEVLGAGELGIELKDFLWDMKFEVRSYNFLYSENGIDKEISVSGNRLTDEVKAVVSALQPGKDIIFKDIKAIAPDKRILDISPLILSLK